MSLSFAVVTKTPTGKEVTGNLAATLDIYQVVQNRTKENDYTEGIEQIPFPVALRLRQPVFHVGEILILDESGREIGYPGRKPGKWDVEIEEFFYLDQAVVRAREVFEASLRSEAAADES
jgi:hypothetical protein